MDEDGKKVTVDKWNTVMYGEKGQIIHYSKYKGNQDWQSVAFIIEEEDCDLPLEVPATSYSSSEDEDFFDAEEDQKSPKVSPA